MSDDQWERVCILCAMHDRQTRLKYGHCCAVCADRLTADVRLVGELASMASVEPIAGTGVGASVFGSKPPINVAGVDPENTLTGPAPSPTVLDVLESWTRMVREERDMAPYGPWSASVASDPSHGRIGTQATLVGCVGFLAAQTEWIVATPDFPLEDYRAEVSSCVRVLRRWDADSQREAAWRVDCPADHGESLCGYSLRISGNDVESYFRCPRCGTEWSVDRLMLVAAEVPSGEMWLDAEAICGRIGVQRSTLDRWARDGRIAKAHGLYDARPILVRRGA